MCLGGTMSPVLADSSPLPLILSTAKAFRSVSPDRISIKESLQVQRLSYVEDSSAMKIRRVAEFGTNPLPCYLVLLLAVTCGHP